MSWRSFFSAYPVFSAGASRAVPRKYGACGRGCANGSPAKKAPGSTAPSQAVALLACADPGQAPLNFAAPPPQAPYSLGRKWGGADLSKSDRKTFFNLRDFAKDGSSFSFFWLGGLLLCFATAGSTAAKDDSNQPRPAHQVGDVVVTATRTETKAAEVASTVTVITAEEIQRLQLRLVTDVLRRVPGVDVRRNGGPGTTTSIFVRGGNSDHVLVLLDGVELNDPSSPSRAPILNDLTTEDIDRIEVVRGPQSVLYGGDAMSGVIQIFTKRGAGKLSVVGSGEGGSYSTARGVLSASGAAGGVSYAASGSHWSTDGFSASEAGTERDPYRNSTASARLGWKMDERFSLDSLFRYSDAKVDFDGFGVETNHFIDTEQILARLAPELKLFNGRWQQTLAGEFSRNERDTTSTFPSRVEGNLYGLDWQNNFRLVDGHLITAGVDNEWEDADFSSFDDERHNIGIYLQDQISWGQRLFGTVGFRYDDPSDFDSQVTYRITAGVMIPEIQSTLRASYGTGFKAPSLSQLNPIAFGGNPDLDPETSKGFDVGIETSLWKDRIVSNATFFYNDVDDLIIAVFDSMSGSFLNFNVDRSKAYGVETTLSIELMPSLRFSGNYTFTHTEAKGTPAGFGITDGSRLLRRPTHKASIDLIWSFMKGRGELNANVLYIGDRRDLDPLTFSAVTADDYVTLNLAGRFHLTRWLTLFGRIDNVTNEDYEDVLGFGTAGVSAYGGIRLRY